MDIVYRTLPRVYYFFWFRFCTSSFSCASSHQGMNAAANHNVSFRFALSFANFADQEIAGSSSHMTGNLHNIPIRGIVSSVYALVNPAG